MAIDMKKAEERIMNFMNENRYFMYPSYIALQLGYSTGFVESILEIKFKEGKIMRYFSLIENQYVIRNRIKNFHEKVEEFKASLDKDSLVNHKEYSRKMCLKCPYQNCLHEMNCIECCVIIKIIENNDKNENEKIILKI